MMFDSIILLGRWKIDSDSRRLLLSAFMMVLDEKSKHFVISKLDFFSSLAIEIWQRNKGLEGPRYK